MKETTKKFWKLYFSIIIKLNIIIFIVFIMITMIYGITKLSPNIIALILFTLFMVLIVPFALVEVQGRKRRMK